VAFIAGGIGSVSHAPPGPSTDPREGQTLQVAGASNRIDYVHGFVPAVKAFLNEGNQHAVFFLLTIEKRADMTRLAEL
jgi:hypothetical protein